MLLSCEIMLIKVKVFFHMFDHHDISKEKRECWRTELSLRWSTQYNKCIFFNVLASKINCVDVSILFIYKIVFEGEGKCFLYG